MFFKKTFMRNILILFAGLFGAYLAFPYLLLCLLAFSYHIDPDMKISFKNLKNHRFIEIHIDDLKIFDAKRGVDIISKRVRLKPVWNREALLGKIALDFNLEDSCLVFEEAKSSSRVPAIFTIPATSGLPYKNISGLVKPIKDGMNLSRVKASGDSIRLDFTGDLFEDGNMNIDAIMHIKEEVVSKMPNEMSNMAFRNEKDGWKSISMKMDTREGAPTALQISGNLVRLKVKEITRK